MNLLESFLLEFDHEMAGTRSIIERVPDSLLDWQAAPSLHTIGWVASHLADTLSWVEVTVKETSFDVAPIDGPAHETPVLGSTREILESFDQNLQTARGHLAGMSDQELAVDWTLLQAGQELFTKPRSALIKELFINHMIHHRGFLIAYLRINSIECPHLYG